MGIDLAFNSFKPIIMLGNYKVNEIKINSGRIIINAKLDDEIQVEESKQVSKEEELERKRKQKLLEEDINSSLIKKSKYRNIKKLINNYNHTFISFINHYHLLIT